MQLRSSFTKSLFAAVVVAFVAACVAADSSTAPSEEQVAIPQLAEAACAEWSCALGVCQYDPAIYGACCILAADAEHSVASRPSCQGPKNGAYCQTFPRRCTSGENTTNLNPPGYCYHANPSQICADKQGCDDLEGPAKDVCLDSCSDDSFSEYNECFADGDPNF